MTLYLVRHASAGDRSSWRGSDDERPLDGRGLDQSDWLAALLGVEPITAILSSHFVRCRQTVSPLASRLGLDIVDEPALAEGASRDAARRVVTKLIDSTAVLCSHGDVIPELLGLLQGEGIPLVGKAANAKASVWRLDVEHGAVQRAVYLPPGV